MSYPVIFRKRLIPDECIELRDDVILEYTPGLIITSWNALKPKKDLHHGFSCYYPDRGYKVSRFCDKNDNLLYWYCDIVDYSYSDDKNRQYNKHQDKDNHKDQKATIHLFRRVAVILLILVHNSASFHREK
mgnify:CR=1 FL=1